MKRGTIIILHGVTSAGKSTLQKAVQEAFDEPYLATGIDDFHTMLPDRYLAEASPADKGILIQRKEDEEGNPLLYVTFGSVGQQVIKGMHRSLGVLASLGCNIVVDHILYHQKWLSDLLITLKSFKVVFVGVHVPLEVAIEREKSRVGKDRDEKILGHVRAYFDVIHKNCVYDLDLDTSKLSPQECAQSIKDFVESGKEPRAFRTMRERLKIK